MSNYLKSFFILLILITPLSHALTGMDDMIQRSLESLRNAQSDYLSNSNQKTPPQSTADTSGSDSIFGFRFDPNTEFSLEFSYTKPTMTTTKVSSPNNPAGTKIDVNIDKKSSTQTYDAYKCSAQLQELSAAANPAIATNLGASIDVLLDGIMAMESDIKASITSSISGYFNSINSYFRPEYIMSKTLEIMVNKGAEYTCASCKTTGLGCDNVFIKADKIYYKSIEKAVQDSMSPSKSRDKKTTTEKGSYVDVAFMGCPNVSLLKGPSGVAFEVKNLNKSNRGEFKSLYIETAYETLLADAMEQCITAQRIKIKSFFEGVLNTAAGSLILETEAQNQCLNENNNALNSAFKNETLINKTAKGYVNEWNYWVGGDPDDKSDNGINGLAQDFTGSILTKINQKINIINTGTIPADKSDLFDASKMVIDEITKPHIGMLPNASVLAILDYSLSKINLQPSSSMSKIVARSMAKQLANSLNLKDVYMINFSNNYKNLTSPNVTNNIDFIKQKNSLLDTLTDYENILVQEIGFTPSRPAPYFACSDFDTSQMVNPNINLCFLERKIQRFTANNSYTPTCTCTEFGKLIDIISNPIQKKKDIELDFKAMVGLPADGSALPWTVQFENLIKGTKADYLKTLTESLIRIQSDSDEYLSNMHILEQKEVQRLFRMTLRNFKL